ncbi:Low-density lipoprotein receptor-related protein [Frankliniella fusca]|uniref:Low-density lipoprotein receptor-related protein n=1 Tax=Frankliniella fusca TaxID=407009 RepID=A0AAE1IWR4_9NEOP|nr:Low-density lipoprotein receptor-related protein [Frankliniella fusca]
MVTLAGEFRVLSERWSPSLADERSAAWRTLADRIQMQLDSLFEASALAAHYRGSTVTSLRPSEGQDVRDAVDVDCDVVLGDAAHMPDLVERAGLAFLRGLRRRAGRAWLGDLAVDVQSIGFVGAPITSDDAREVAGSSAPTPTAVGAGAGAEPDPAVPGWAPWSSWSECYWTGSSAEGRGGGSSSGTMVRLRSRTCALDGGRGRALDGPEPCLLRLPSAGSPFEMEACQSQPAPGAPTAATILIQDTVVALSPSKPAVRVGNTSASPGASTTPPPAGTSTAQPPSSTPTTSSPSSSVISRAPPGSLSPTSTPRPAAVPSLATPATSASTLSPEPNPSPFSMTTLLVPVIVTQRPVTTTTTAAAIRSEPRYCDECLEGEVCVGLGEETVPRCRAVKDPLDPTGCGGLCKLNFEFCQRLDVDAFRCVDDSVCLPGEWRCGNQLCIPLVKRCDGHFNCYDHTDEHNCDCNLQTHFQCGNNTSCLPKSKRCDGVVDCWDAADELNCTKTISLSACPRQDQFTCSNGQCISHARFCDGFADCGDKSDEPFGCGGDCKNHEWKCGNGRCIRKRAVCNGADDCGDLSDEKECRKSRLPGS